LLAKRLRGVRNDTIFRGVFQPICLTSAEQVIGEVGKSGRSTGTRLNFKLQKSVIHENSCWRKTTVNCLKNNKLNENWPIKRFLLGNDFLKSVSRLDDNRTDNTREVDHADRRD